MVAIVDLAVVEKREVRVGRNEEIIHLFVVNLQHGEVDARSLLLYSILLARSAVGCGGGANRGGRVVVANVEELADRRVEHAAHCVGLTRAGLAVAHEARVAALERAAHSGLSRRVSEELIRILSRARDVVEVELLLLAGAVVALIFESANELRTAHVVRT